MATFGNQIQNTIVELESTVNQKVDQIQESVHQLEESQTNIVQLWKIIKSKINNAVQEVENFPSMNIIQEKDSLNNLSDIVIEETSSPTAMDNVQNTEGQSNTANVVC